MLHTISLKKNYQFRTVYNKGRSYASHHLVIYFLKNNKDINRLGISVSKKVGKSVIRSHKTRIIRESYRLLENNVKIGYDIVIIARVSAKDSSFHEISKSIEKLFTKMNLFDKTPADYQKLSEFPASP